MNKKGFVSSSLIYSFIIVFIALIAAIIGTYAYYQGIIFSSNRDVTNSLNNLIESKYFKITNYLKNSGFEYPSNPSSAIYDTDYLVEIHYNGSKDYKLDSTIENWNNDRDYAYRYIKNVRYSGDYALMLGTYNYSEIYQNGTQSNTYNYEVGKKNVSRNILQKLENLSVGTHYIYVSSKILRNQSTNGDNKINITCSSGCYVDGNNSINLNGGYSDWYQDSIVFKIEVTDNFNVVDFSIESNTNISGAYILIDELLFTDVTDIINANSWNLDEAKEYFDGTKLNSDGTINNRYKINYFEGTISYELLESYEKINITFDNGNDVAKTYISLTAGQNLFTIAPPKRENYTFLGYFSSPNGTGTRYFDRLGRPNENETINKNMTLYAFWTNEVFYYPYTGTVERLLITAPGSYKLEAWGAQGGSVSKNNTTYSGGYGGYSIGMLDISYNTYLYLAVGEKGSDNFNNSTTISTSFNGGGGANCTDNNLCAGGGGASHIATINGVLSGLESNKSSIILVAGGGGGAIVTGNDGKNGGSGGGYIGSGATSSDNGGTQSNGFSFGQGESGNNYSGSGGGYYGGRASTLKIGTGGSGYVNNSLYDKKMYCYNCQSSESTDTYTISTNNIYRVDDGEYEPISYSAKEGNGFIKITKINGTLDNYFELTFDGNADNVNLDFKTIWVLHNSKYGVLPTATRDGYEFDGWYTKREGGTRIDENDIVTLTESQTIYAHWRLANYSVNFDATGGTVNPQSKQVTYTKTYGDLPIPFRIGYEFDGWYTKFTSGNKITSESVVIENKTHTLYAHWKSNEYIVYFDANGGLIDTQNINVLFGNNYGYLPIPTKDEYIFIGWYTEKEGGDLISNSTIYKTPGNQTLYAHWTNEKYNFKIETDQNIASFNVKVGNNPILSQQTYYNEIIPYFTNIEISEINAKIGYHYSGFTSFGPIEKINVDNISFLKIRLLEGDASINLVAAPNKFTILFSSGTGKGFMESRTCVYDQDCYLPENQFTKANTTFAGWLDSNGTPHENLANLKNIVSEDGGTITLTAIWKDEIETDDGGSSGGGGC